MDASLVAFISERCIAYNIDESHGLKHSQDTVGWAIQLLDAETDITEDERRMTIYCAALHDMCDRKYVDETIAVKIIRSWLTLVEKWTYEMAAVLIDIITTMSYSKLKKTKVWPNHGKWQRAYNIARHADLLDAFIPMRCYLYQKHITPEISDATAWSVVHDLFEVRVFRYVSDGWITLSLAVKLAEGLTKEALVIIKSNNP